jgi:hypothetical protein
MIDIDEQLISVCREASYPDWDGEGSSAVSLVTVQIVRDFVDTLSNEYRYLTIVPENDGHVSMEWYKDKQHLLSISVSLDRTMYWAALIGSELTIVPENDGHVSMEWYKDKQHLLSISVSIDRTMYWAALIGSESSCGAFVFFGEVPKDILSLLSQVYNN